MPDEARAEAPGRVNLIGEHTDYHEGYVLPAVIPQRTSVHLRKRPDRRVRAASAAMNGVWQEYELRQEAPGRGWLDYVQGATAVLRRRGLDVGGFDARIESTIPPGAGVSSSAALEVSLLRALRVLFAFELDDVSLARAAQAVETEFVGAPIGIMDQIAASVGRDGEALFLDTRTLAFERIPLPPHIEIAAIDSTVPHAHAGGAYSTRRKESYDAAAALGVQRLRDVSLDALPRIARLPGVLARRARHIVTENQRVLDAVTALRAGDGVGLGRLFAESHASMRDDYETSTPDVDALVEIARQHPDVYGARLTGGGFGGAVVMIARRGTARRAAEQIRGKYRERTGRAGAVLVPVN